MSAQLRTVLSRSAVVFTLLCLTTPSTVVAGRTAGAGHAVAISKSQQRVHGLVKELAAPTLPDYDAWFDELVEIHDLPLGDPDQLLAPPSQLMLKGSATTYASFVAPIGDVFTWDGPSFDIAAFEQNIRDALDGKVVGYAYAINYKKQLYSADSNGKAQTDADGDIAQSPYKVMNTASISKLLTTIAVLQLLEKNGLTIDDPIWPWLPDGWKHGTHLVNVDFKHLLTHQTGWSDVESKSWNGLKDMVEGVASPSSADLNDGSSDAGYAYENANFGLFRILVPALWAASSEDPGIDYIEDWSSSVWYAVYMQDNVFEPLGIDHALCVNVENDPVLYYRLDAPDEQGHDGGNWIDYCMFGGWYLSAYDLAKIMAYLRYTDVLLSAQNRALMDEEFLGWNSPDAWSTWVRGDHGVYYTHGADLRFRDGDDNIVGESHGCVMRFPIQVEVALLMNSSRDFSDYQCTVLRKAFDDAWS